MNEMNAEHNVTNGCEGVWAKEKNDVASANGFIHSVFLFLFKGKARSEFNIQ